jgi:hypothetical protein
MVDGIDNTVAHGVFGSLRHELWTLDGITWVVAGDSAAEALYLEPSADAFFEQTVRLGPLTDPDAAKLLRAHVPSLSAPQVKRATAVAEATLDDCFEPPPTSRREQSRPARRLKSSHSGLLRSRARWPVRSSRTSQSTGQRLRRTSRCCVKSARAGSEPAHAPARSRWAARDHRAAPGRTARETSAALRFATDA